MHHCYPVQPRIASTCPDGPPDRFPAPGRPVDVERTGTAAKALTVGNRRPPAKAVQRGVAISASPRLTDFELTIRDVFRRTLTSIFVRSIYHPTNGWRFTFSFPRFAARRELPLPGSIGQDGGVGQFRETRLDDRQDSRLGFDVFHLHDVRE